MSTMAQSVRTWRPNAAPFNNGTRVWCKSQISLLGMGGRVGAEFDKAFLQNEVGYHDAVIGAVTKTLLPAIQNAELKDLVTKVAPAFVAHRDAAKNLLDKQPM
jgi:predicted outer membrane protein